MPSRLRIPLPLHLLHVWWPVALGWSVATVVERATGRTSNGAGLAVLLLGIAAAYSLDRALDAPPAWPASLRRTLLAVTAAAATLALWLLPAVPAPSAALVPVAGVVALAYRQMKRVPLAKTLGVPLVWTWCGIGLPAGDGSWLAWHALTEPVALPIFLLLTAGCLLCDVKDATRDRVDGVPSVPALVGARTSLHLAAALALIACVVAAATGRPGLACSAAALCAVTFLPALVTTDVVGPLAVDVLLTLPGLLIAARIV